MENFLKCLMIRVSPKDCSDILNGKKTIIINKTKPRRNNFRCYVYCSDVKKLNLTNYVSLHQETGGKCDSWSNKVIGEFICNQVDKFLTEFYQEDDTYQEIRKVWIDEDDHEDDFQIITTNEMEDPDKCHLLINACTTFKGIKKTVGLGNDKQFYGWNISDLKIYERPREINEFKKPCSQPNMPYCPTCKVGYEYISESEEEAYRAFGECDTEWICLNWMKKPPQGWCYVQEFQRIW